MNNRSFLKHAAVYGLANLLVKASGFVLLPLYTRCLTPSDFGLLEVLGRLAETVGTILMFGGFRQALLTFYQQSQHEAERRRVVVTLLSLFGLTGLLGGGLMLALARPLAELLNGYMHAGTPAIHVGLLRLAILAILLDPLSQFPMALIQARMESVRFVSITLTQFFVRIALCVLLVKYLQGGVAGALGATALMGLLFGLTLSARELLRGLARPSLEQVHTMLRFTLPLVPGGLCFFLMHHGDRFFLLRYCGTEDVGTYALGYKLALAAGMFSLSPLYMVWSAQMYQEAKLPTAPVVFGAMFTRILTAYLLVALAVALFQDEVVHLLGSAAYARASSVVAPVLLAYFFQSAASLMDAGLYVRHRTGLKLGITLVSTAVMLACYAVLIPKLGGMGAAFATLIGFAFLAVCTWVVTQRVFPVRYEWPQLLAMLLLAMGLWLLSRLLPVAAWTWPVKGGLWLLWPTVVWYTGVMSHGEKEHVRVLTGEARRRLMDCLTWSRTYRPPAKYAAASPADIPSEHALIVPAGVSDGEQTVP